MLLYASLCHHIVRSGDCCIWRSIILQQAVAGEDCSLPRRYVLTSMEYNGWRLLSSVIHHCSSDDASAAGCDLRLNVQRVLSYLLCMVKVSVRALCKMSCWFYARSIPAIGTGGLVSYKIDFSLGFCCLVSHKVESGAL